MARGTIVTPADKNTMLALSRKGSTRAELAKQFHCSLGTVGNVVGKTSAKAKTGTRLKILGGGTAGVLQHGFAVDGFWYQRMGKITKI